MRPSWTNWCLKRAAICAVTLWATSLLCARSADATTIRQRIVSLAEQEIGYHDHGYYCTKFGPCETWCSLFVTWVWRRRPCAEPRLHRL